MLEVILLSVVFWVGVIGLDGDESDLPACSQSSAVIPPFRNLCELNLTCLDDALVWDPFNAVVILPMSEFLRIVHSFLAGVSSSVRCTGLLRNFLTDVHDLAEAVVHGE